MATYEQIQLWIKDHHGFTPKFCWIADVKEQAGLPVKRAWNRIGEIRENPCPPPKIDAIENAFQYFGMINYVGLKKGKNGNAYHENFLWNRKSILRHFRKIFHLERS